MKIAFVSVAVFGLFAGFVNWSEAHTREANQAAQAYERCVQQQYHMTPIAWYEQHQEYPACGN